MLAGPSASPFVLSGFATAPRPAVAELHRAFVMLQRLRIVYRDERAKVSTRTIEPHYLLFNYPVRYALAWDELRDGVRTFRCGRIDKAEALDGAAAVQPGRQCWILRRPDRRTWRLWQQLSSSSKFPVASQFVANRQSKRMFDDLPTDPTKKDLQFSGAVDRISPTDGIHGWALDTQNPSSVIELQVWCGGFVLAGTRTGLPRPDISAVIKAESKSGFAVSWQSFDLAYVQQLLAGREHEPVYVLAPAGKGALVYACDPLDLSSLYSLIGAAKAQVGRATGGVRPAISQAATLVTPAASVHFDTMSGSLTIASREPGEGYDIFVDGKFSGIRHPALQSFPIGRVNRLTDSEFTGPTLNWQADNFPIAKNLSPEWALEDANTAYVRGKVDENEKPVVAIFTCPIDGRAIGIKAGEDYCFQALFALHRCMGTIRLVFLDEAGTVIGSAQRAIPPEFEGGPKVASYAHVSLVARAPAGATRLRIEIEKGVTLRGAESLLFFTRPSLTRGPEKPSFDALLHTVSAIAASEIFRSNSGRFYVCNVALPGEVMDGSLHTFRVKERGSGTWITPAPLEVQIGEASTGVIYGIEGSVLVARIDVPKGWSNAVSVSLWIDGQPEGRLFFSHAGGSSVRLPLPADACDGRPHLFEIRLGMSGELLAQLAALGPVQATPWDNIQQYAGMPLPAQLAPVAAYRYASLAAPRGNKGGVDRAALHEILLAGFGKPRRQFLNLPFPKAAKPDVSIVIPVHNKFDVTYNCLAALLFAETRADFEVIVVDDGSSDTTTRLNDVAPGVVYVRNKAAVGFVGACNAGADVARGRYIVFLNNDTEPTAHWLDELLFVFENFDGVGLAGSKLIYPDGTLQEAGGIVWETGDPANYGRSGNPWDPRYSYTRICDYLSGAAIMIPADLWRQLGGFSQEFAPAYFEDTDLAFKVRNAGRKVVFAPRSVVIHYEGLSNGTDETASSGLKRFQEINRPKFKRKWPALFAGNGKADQDVDLAKDRGVSKRVLFIDAEFPRPDQDAGSYAAIQEIRMFQAMGCKVTFVPLNLYYIGRHTDNLQRMGVETIHRPFYPDMATFLKVRGAEFDLIYITRYGVADQVLESIARSARRAKTVINVADLHFLRSIRGAIAEGSAAKIADALELREAELAALGGADLVLSYSKVEQVVITSHLPGGPKTGIVPWAIDTIPVTVPFAKRKDIAFIGGFRHAPNVAAVRYFADEIMPLLRKALPGVRFLVYGSHMPPEIEALDGEDVAIKGYVADVAEAFSSCRIFVAPLLSGAGMKGKVLDCMAAGIPSVLSPIAAEGIELRAGVDAVIADRPEEWVAGISRLYRDEKAWNAMSKSVQELAATRYSFKAGVETLRDSLAAIDFFVPGDRSALHVNSARPAAPAAVRPTHEAKEFTGAVSCTDKGSP